MGSWRLAVECGTGYVYAMVLVLMTKIGMCGQPHQYENRVCWGPGQEPCYRLRMQYGCPKELQRSAVTAYLSGIAGISCCAL
jgi:hypothetical protein